MKQRLGKKGLYWVAGIVSVVLSIFIYVVMRGNVEIPSVISLGIINIHAYGLIIFLAILLAAVLARRLIQLDKIKLDFDITEALLYVLIPAVIGARIYHVLTDFQLYRANLIGVFEIWNGGLGLIGGLIGGYIGLHLLCRHKHLNLTKVIRSVVVVVPLGQAVGRIGNLINQELFGPPTDSPFGMYVRIQNRPVGYEQYEFFQPLFLYEMLANLILAGVLFYLWKKGLDGKHMLFMYVVGYGAIRYILDFFRLEGGSGLSLGGIFLTYTQWLVLGILLFVLIFGWSYQLWYKRKYGKWFTNLGHKS